MKPLPRFALLLALAALTGCAALQSLLAGAFQQPTLTFKTANLREVTFDGATVDLVYTVQNPNGFGLKLANVDYAFAVEGRHVVSGKPPNGLDLAANGSSDVTFPASFRFADVAPVLHTFLNKDTAHYKAEGHVGIDTPVGVVTLPLAHEGSFEVPKLPVVQLQTPRITSVGFNGIGVELPLTVTNRNTFELPVDAVRGALDVGGSEVASLGDVAVGRLGGRASKQLTLPLRFSLGGIAQASSLLAGAPTRVSVRGQVQSGAASLPFQVSQQLSFQR